MSNIKNRQRIFKDPVSGLTHLLTAFGAVFGSVWLLSSAQTYGFKWWGLLIYCLSLIILFSASSAYHLIPANRKWAYRLRKIDHAAIFFFIAGSYTPICQFALTGRVQFLMLIAIWVVAAVGIALKLLFARSNKWLSVGAYLASGWIALLAIGDFYKGLPSFALFWLIVGGIFYSVGAIIYATKKFDFVPNVFGHHEVWHLFVMAGSFSHFVLVSVFIV